MKHTLLAVNNISLRKLFEVGELLKTEVRLYTDNSERRHVCSLYIELEEINIRKRQKSFLSSDILQELEMI